LLVDLFIILDILFFQFCFSPNIISC